MSEGNIEYYAIEGVPGRFFKCPKGVGKLSDKSCAKLYEEAMSPRGLREGLRFACRSCPLGAQHAGADPHEAGSMRFLSRLSCARCLKQTCRLIRGSICVSCYNREREVVIGRNAKGNKPVHGRPIGSPAVYCRIGGVWQLRKLDRVASRLEAVLTVTRSEPHSGRFGWAPMPFVKGGDDATRSIRLG